MGSREREETERRGGEEIGRPSLGWERGKVMLLWFIVRSAFIIGHHHVSVALYSLQHVRERSSMLAAATNDGPLFLSSLSSVPPLSPPLLSPPFFSLLFPSLSLSSCCPQHDASRLSHGWVYSCSSWPNIAPFVTRKTFSQA